MTSLSSKVYDLLKFISQIVFPALGTLYFVLAGIWDFPNVEEVVGIIVVVDTLLGVVLQLNSNTYKNKDDRFDGVINVIERHGKTTFSLDVPGDPHKIAEAKEILFKVIKT